MPPPSLDRNTILLPSGEKLGGRARQSLGPTRIRDSRAGHFLEAYQLAHDAGSFPRLCSVISRSAWYTHFFVVSSSSGSWLKRISSGTAFCRSSRESIPESARLQAARSRRSCDVSL